MLQWAINFFEIIQNAKAIIIYDLYQNRTLQQRTSATKVLK